MSERSPVYNKGRTHRVVSGPNGMWVPQEFKDRDTNADTAKVDGWRATHRPQPSKQQAMALVPNMPNG